MSRAVRAIVGARVSRVIDHGSKTSHTTQREAGEKYAAAMDWEVVGYFEDLDVSATITPWERPDLGPWLNERANEWDAIIWSKVDRAFRDTKDCADVAHWAEKNGKILVFTDDGIVCDFRTEDASSQNSMIAKLFLMMSSMFAEMELKRFKMRNRDARRYLNQRNRWPGGRPPYGFKVVDHPEGGKTLVIDEETAGIVRIMGKMFLEGYSTQEIAEYFTAQGYPTPSQHWAANSNGGRRKTPPSPIWSKVSISQMLKSPVIMGYKVLGKHKKVLARDDEGMPVRWSDPIFTEEEWHAIQGELKRRGTERERRKDASPLLGVVYCDSCGSRLYRNVNNAKGHTYVYYRCPPLTGKPACPAHGWREEFVRGVVDENILTELANIPVTRKVFVPGENHTAELKLVNEAIEGLLDQFEEKAFDFPGGDRIFKERMKRLGERKAELEKLPQRADAWVDEPTGETYAEAYRRMDDQERRMLLITAGVKVYFGPNRYHMYVPDDLREKAGDWQFVNDLGKREVKA